MKCIIAGSRDIEDYEIIEDAIIESGFKISTIVSGGARGVDLAGERYAAENNLKIDRYDAEWNQYGNSAGIIRNKKMAENSDGLIAIWDGKSKGTKHMIETARKHGVLMELNANPERLDLNAGNLRAATRMGLKMTINTDAHKIIDLDFMRFGVYQARRGWLTKNDVVNTYPLSKLMKVLRK